MSLFDRFRKKGVVPFPSQGTPGKSNVSTGNGVPGNAASGNGAVEGNPALSVFSAPSLADGPAVAAATPAAQAAGEAPAEPTIRAYDEFGREVLLPVSQWRREVLPPALEQARSNPDALSAVLLDALQAGAAEEIVASAAHLQSIDTFAERGAAVHGLVLLAANKPAEAEDVLVTYLGQHGPSAPVLTHLARAQAVQGRMDEADATLWRALEADPNDDGAVALYAARSREREGDFGWQSALERAATLDGAWLPLLWLGRSAVEARNRTLAVGLYKQAIERAGQPSPTLLLQGVSGDLGQFGLLDDAIRLVRPVFEPEVHGMAVGSNLLRATLDKGESAEALALVRDLGRLNRPEFAPSLRAWEVEIRRRDLLAEAQKNPPQPQLLRIDGPLWLPPSTPGRQLYGGGEQRRGSVLFLGSSVGLPEQLGPEAAPLPDTAGRLSRALPLFLAENAFALLALDTQTLVPWAEIGGFAMLNQPWPDEAAASYARDAGAQVGVSVHLEATPEGGTVTLRVVPAAVPHSVGETGIEPVTPERAEDKPQTESTTETQAESLTGSTTDALTGHAGEPRTGDSAPAQTSENLDDLEASRRDSGLQEAQTISVNFTWPELHTGVQSLWPQLAIPLVTRFGDAPEPPRPGRYAPPRGPELNLYLRALEQLLGVNCATTSPNAPFLVTGERETLRGMLDLALRNPNSLSTRFMLGELLLRLRGLHPEVLGEFAQPLAMLNDRHPITDPDAAEILKAQWSAAMNPEPQVVN